MIKAKRQFLEHVRKQLEFYVNPSEKLLPWSIKLFYSAQDDDGKRIRVNSVMQVMAKDIPSAYVEAEKILEEKPDATFGAIIPGWQDKFF